MPLKTIENLEEYELRLSEMKKLLLSDSLHLHSNLLVEILITFENIHFPMDKPTPGESVRYILESLFGEP